MIAAIARAHGSVTIIRKFQGKTQGSATAFAKISFASDVDRFIATGLSDIWQHINVNFIEHPYTNPKTGNTTGIDLAVASPCVKSVSRAKKVFGWTNRPRRRGNEGLPQTALK